MPDGNQYTTEASRINSRMINHTVEPQRHGFNTDHASNTTTDGPLDISPDCTTVFSLIKLKNRTLDERPGTSRRNLSNGTYVALGVLFVLSGVLIVATGAFILKRCFQCSCQLTWSCGEQNSVEPAPVELTEISTRGRQERDGAMQKGRLTSRSAPYPQSLFQSKGSPTSALASCPQLTTSNC